MSFAPRRAVLALVLAAATALAVTSGTGTASAALWRPPTVALSAPTVVSTTYGHSTVLPVAVRDNPTGAGARLRWCVVPKGATTCWTSQGSVPVPAGASTVWTRPLSIGSLRPGTNSVHLWYTYEHVAGTRGLTAAQVARDGLPSVRTTVKVAAEKPHVTVSLDRKVVAAKDLRTKRVGVYAWVGVTGVSQSVTGGRMAVYVDGRRATPWTQTRSLPIPGGTSRKPAISVKLPVSALTRRGTHGVQVRYQATGAAAEVVGTATHGSLTRTFRTQ